MEEKPFQATLDIQWENGQLTNLIWFLKLNAFEDLMSFIYFMHV